MSFDVLIVGAGHNGLVAATFLAKAGLKTIVLERSDRVGGCARLAHTAAIDPAIVRALGLERHGLQIVRPAAAVCAPTLDGRALTLWRDPARAAHDIRAWSAKDAEQYPKFLESFARIGRVVRTALESTPPSIDDPTAGDLIELLKTGRGFRALGRPDAYRLLRWMPMAVADLVGEWFDGEPLRAAIAAGGVLGSFLGPWSAGSAAVLLLLGAAEGHPIASGWFAKGGLSAVIDSLAAAAGAADVEIRTGAAGDVAQIDIAPDGAATGVTLVSGQQIAARIVASNADPKRTLLGLVDPIHLPPEIVRRVQNIRAHGTLAKVNYTVSSPPRFPGVSDVSDTGALSGRIRLARDIDGIERAFDAAKYGGYADEPWIELTIPSIIDSSLAPAGQHLVSAYVQYAPYHLRGTTWDVERDRLGDTATRTIARYAPGFESSIVAREVITPLDLERAYGLTGGHIFHGELALDQVFVARPLLGFARYATPVRNLYICGSGAHPGTGIDGRAGALAATAIVKALRK